MGQAGAARAVIDQPCRRRRGRRHAPPDPQASACTHHAPPQIETCLSHADAGVMACPKSQTKDGFELQVCMCAAPPEAAARDLFCSHRHSDA